MKKLLTIIGVTLSFLLSGQNYQQLYDQNCFNQQASNSTSSDQNTITGWGFMNYMESLFMMYEKTNDIKYLDKLVYCMGNTIDRRDDLRENIGLAKIINNEGSCSPTWSNSHSAYGTDGPFPWISHNGYITYPMAKFAALIKNSNDVNLTQKIHYDCSRYYGLTYTSIANDLIARVRETLAYYEPTYYKVSTDFGYYITKAGANSASANKIPALNELSLIGRVFIHMYRATNEYYFQYRVLSIANFFKKYTHKIEYYQSYYQWKYMEYNSTMLEDLSHGGTTIRFPYECYKYGISYYGYPIYTETHMNCYKYTYWTLINKSKYAHYQNLGSKSYYWDFQSNMGVGSLAYAYSAAGFLMLSEFDKSIYTSIMYKLESQYYLLSLDIKTDPLHLAYICKFKPTINKSGSIENFGENINSNESIQMYPIPTKGILNIDIKSENLLNSKIKIIDIEGRIIRYYELKDDNEKLDLSDLKKGIYLINIKNQNFNETKKIILE